MLKIGSSGEETRQWQAFLNLHGYDVGGIDGKFGLRVETSTAKFQVDNGLDADGIVGPATYKTAFDLGFRVAGAEYKFIPAKHFTAGRGGAIVNLIVLHTTEGPETDHRSEATAAMFHEGESEASANYIVDPAEIMQSVLEQDASWHSGHHATNMRSIGIEQCGTAQQTPEQWADDASSRELRNVAKLCAKLCVKYVIPRIKLSPEDVAAGASGFCGHIDVTIGLNKGKGHRDPGRDYPWAAVLAMVEQEIDALNAASGGIA
jgi:N-acetyl-anhydromuramyl-L-alanine amidase AmpD